MWTNTQRDGRSAEYRWRPLFNAPKVWLTLTAKIGYLTVSAPSCGFVYTQSGHVIMTSLRYLISEIQ